MELSSLDGILCLEVNMDIMEEAMYSDFGYLDPIMGLTMEGSNVND